MRSGRRLKLPARALLLIFCVCFDLLFFAHTTGAFKPAWTTDRREQFAAARHSEVTMQSLHV